MKVAMVTPYWFPVLGGLTTYVAELTRELRSTFAIDATVVAREGGAPGATILGGDAREFARRALKELRRSAPDVVHAHGHWYALKAALDYRRGRGDVRVVFTLHTELERGGRLRSTALSRLFSRADAATAVSQHLLDRMRRSFRLPHLTAVTLPGVSIRPTTVEETTEFLRSRNLVDRRPLIAFVGPLAHERKVEGVKGLLTAMAIVRAKFPRATLVVAGEGPFRRSLERLAEAEVPGGAVFLGGIANPAPLFSAADVYAHISFQEALGLAVLEAMACGTPVVATATGGIPEVLRDGETGRLTSGEPSDVASKILGLLDDSATSRALAARAQAVATNEFTWSNAASRFLPLYRPDGK